MLLPSPTPVQLLSRLGTSSSALWVKRDDLTPGEYGGNKARKLQHLLREADRAQARRLVMVASAGSHQVLATALLARKHGLEVAAVLGPQPRTDHAARVLRAIVGLGVEVHPAGGVQVPRALWRLWRRGDFLLPLGGSSAESLAGHMDAAEELAQAVEDKALPLPDVVVVALASGGTAVGLAAGLARRRLPVQVLAVCATHRSAGARVFVWNQLAKLAGKWPGWVAGAAGRLRLEPRFLGAGYSLPTAESERAHQLGQVEGLTLDPAYTAKAFAASLALVQRAQVRNVLFWQTHASTSLEPLLREAPDEASLPRALRALLLPLEGPCASS